MVMDQDQPMGSPSIIRILLSFNVLFFLENIVFEKIFVLHHKKTTTKKQKMPKDVKRLY